MSQFRLIIFLLLIGFVYSCKKEHPDLVTAFDLYKEASLFHQNLIIGAEAARNDAKALDGRIRNSDTVNVFTISEVYNHLELVDEGLAYWKGRPKGVPGHEKEANGQAIFDAKLVPAQILTFQKQYRDSIMIVKNDLDAAAALISSLKQKLN